MSQTTGAQRRRRRRPWFGRLWSSLRPRLLYIFDVHYARRSDAGKKAARTRRARRGESMAKRPVER